MIDDLQTHLKRMQNLLLLEYFFDNVVEGHSITFMGRTKSDLQLLSDSDLEFMAQKAFTVSENLNSKVIIK